MLSVNLNFEVLTATNDFQFDPYDAYSNMFEVHRRSRPVKIPDSIEPGAGGLNKTSKHYLLILKTVLTHHRLGLGDSKTFCTSLGLRVRRISRYPDHRISHVTHML